MDARMKSKWPAALRSGKYQQGTGYLNAGGRFCCLGVLCDISGAGRWIPEGDSIVRYKVASDGCRATLPFALQDQYGLSNEALSVLIRMNDDGQPFAEIADYIEAKL